MHPSFGPSLRLVLALADGLAEISAIGLTAAWDHWIGPKRFQRKLAQLTRMGLVEIRGSNLARVVRLTEKGRLAALGGRDPEACWRRPWDGRWRLVLFDVPETEKNQRLMLRRTLRAAGFGYLQNSAWITPDTAETLRQLAGTTDVDAGTLSFFEGGPCAGETNDQIVDAAWDFVRINRQYDLYCELLNSRPGRAASRSAWGGWFDTEWRAWRIAVSADPLLPEPLLPLRYRGRAAWIRHRDTWNQLMHY